MNYLKEVINGEKNARYYRSYSILGSQGMGIQVDPCSGLL